MKVRHLLFIFISLILVGLLVSDIEARRGRRGGGGFSRAGVASRGSFRPPQRIHRRAPRRVPSRKAVQARPAPRRDRSARPARPVRPNREASREVKRPHRPKRDRATESKRQEAQKKVAKNREEWQEWMDERQEDRQDFIEDLQEERQEFIEDQIDRHHYHHHHGGFATGVIVGGVVGGAVASSGDTTYVTTLPCSPEILTVDGVEYYRCDSDWYRRSYSGSQVVYIVVQSPR